MAADTMPKPRVRNSSCTALPLLLFVRRHTSGLTIKVWLGTGNEVDSHAQHLLWQGDHRRSAHGLLELTRSILDRNSHGHNKTRNELVAASRAACALSGVHYSSHTHMAVCNESGPPRFPRTRRLT